MWERKGEGKLQALHDFNRSYVAAISMWDKVNLRANHTHSCHKLLAFIAPPTTHQLSRNHNLCARLPTLITTFHSLPRRTHVLCAIVLRVRPTRLTFLRVRLTLLLLPGMLTSPPPCSANNIGQHSRFGSSSTVHTFTGRRPFPIIRSYAQRTSATAAKLRSSKCRSRHLSNLILNLAVCTLKA